MRYKIATWVGDKLRNAQQKQSRRVILIGTTKSTPAQGFRPVLQTPAPIRGEKHRLVFAPNWDRLSSHRVEALCLMTARKFFQAPI